MKNLFGKILAGTIGCVAALSLSAFAATPAITLDVTEEVVGGAKTGIVTVKGTITNPAEAMEATILVAPENTTLAEVTDENIKYIDQDAVAEGSFEFKFKLVTGVKYNVWCGGTDVTVDGIGDDKIDLTAVQSGYKIVGTITLAEGAKFDKVTAKAGDVAGTVSADGTYSIAVADGEYVVVIGRTGYLYKTATVTVAGADATHNVALVPGNVAPSDEGVAEIINSADLDIILNNYLAEAGDDNYNADWDANDDAIIAAADLDFVLNNYLAE